MNLSEAQISQYQQDGFLLLPSVLDRAELDLLLESYDRDCEVAGPHRILEDDGQRVRAVYASYQRQAEFDGLIRDPRLLGPVQQLLTDDVYMYQFKINAKPAFGGERWAWHQDFTAWKIVDQLPLPSQVNVAVFLDDVDEFNGPLIVIPGSHRHGLLSDERHGAKSSQHLDPDDIALSPEQLQSLVADGGMVSATAPAGSLLFFSTEIVHGSAPNMSPIPRRVLISTYNDCSNLPYWPNGPRPDYVVGQDVTPLRPLAGTFADELQGALA